MKKVVLTLVMMAVAIGASAQNDAISKYLSKEQIKCTRYTDGVLYSRIFLLLSALCCHVFGNGKTPNVERWLVLNCI